MSDAGPATRATTGVSLASNDTVCQVAIVSDKSQEGPPNGNILEDLANYCYIHSLDVHKFFCVRGAMSYDRPSNSFRDYVHVLHTKQCKETYVTDVRQLCSIQSNLMIVCGHGFRDTEKGYLSVLLCSKNKEADSMIYASSKDMPFPACVSMKTLARNSCMLMLCCCHGDEIVPLYLTDLTADTDADAAEGSPTPKRQRMTRVKQQEILYFNTNTILELCPDILMLLIISLADGQWLITTTDAQERLRPHILRVMQIVRLFKEDADGFFDFLKAIKLVEMLEDVKRQQQSEFRWERKKYFRTGGHKCTTTLTEDVKKELLAGMRSLTLVTWSAALGHRQELTVTCDLLPDIAFVQPAEEGQEHVDRFLLAYASRDIPDIIFAQPAEEGREHVDRFLLEYANRDARNGWPAWLSTAAASVPGSCIIAARASALAPLRLLLAELSLQSTSAFVSRNRRYPY